MTSAAWEGEAPAEPSGRLRTLHTLASRDRLALERTIAEQKLASEEALARERLAMERDVKFRELEMELQIERLKMKNRSSGGQGNLPEAASIQ